jgi:hypothetical protein
MLADTMMQAAANPLNVQKVHVIILDNSGSMKSSLDIRRPDGTMYNTDARTVQLEVVKSLANVIENDDEPGNTRLLMATIGERTNTMSGLVVGNGPENLTNQIARYLSCDENRSRIWSTVMAMLTRLIALFEDPAYAAGGVVVHLTIVTDGEDNASDDEFYGAAGLGHVLMCAELADLRSRNVHVVIHIIDANYNIPEEHLVAAQLTGGSVVKVLDSLKTNSLDELCADFTKKVRVSNKRAVSRASSGKRQVLGLNRVQKKKAEKSNAPEVANLLKEVRQKEIDHNFLDEEKKDESDDSESSSSSSSDDDVDMEDADASVPVNKNKQLGLQLGNFLCNVKDEIEQHAQYIMLQEIRKAAIEGETEVPVRDIEARVKAAMKKLAFKQALPDKFKPIWNKKTGVFGNNEIINVMVRSHDMTKYVIHPDAKKVLDYMHDAYAPGVVLSDAVKADMEAAATFVAELQKMTKKAAKASKSRSSSEIAVGDPEEGGDLSSPKKKVKRAA